MIIKEPINVTNNISVDPCIDPSDEEVSPNFNGEFVQIGKSLGRQHFPNDTKSQILNK